MTRVLAIFLFLLVWLSVPIAAMAQDLSTFQKKAEGIVKMKNPAWKLIRKQERDKLATYQWGPGKADVTLTIFYGASEQEAADVMKAALNRLSMGSGKKRSDIGDEAYSWESERGGSAGIRFRKANVYVALAAISRDIVEDIARKLVEQIPKN